MVGWDLGLRPFGHLWRRGSLLQLEWSGGLQAAAAQPMLKPPRRTWPPSALQRVNQALRHAFNLETARETIPGPHSHRRAIFFLGFVPRKQELCEWVGFRLAHPACLIL